MAGTSRNGVLGVPSGIPSHMAYLLTTSHLFLSTQFLNDSSAFALVLGKPQHRKRFATSIRVGPSNRNWADHHCLQLVTKCLLRRKYYSLGARADWLVHSCTKVLTIALWGISWSSFLAHYVANRYDVKECATHGVYWGNLKFKDRNFIDAWIYT